MIVNPGSPATGSTRGDEGAISSATTARCIGPKRCATMAPPRLASERRQRRARREGARARPLFPRSGRSALRSDRAIATPSPKQRRSIMARVQGVKEKLHSPLYDAFFVPGSSRVGSPARKFSDVMTDPRAIRFFVDVQNKTRLETNLQAAGVLPSLNNFEARALRVVVSNPPCLIEPGRDPARGQQVLRRVPGRRQKRIQGMRASSSSRRSRSSARTSCAQVSSIVAELIYNSVTTLLVGEKTMIEMPTYFFPAGAGVSPGNGGRDQPRRARSHGDLPLLGAGHHRASTELPGGDRVPARRSQGRRRCASGRCGSGSFSTAT